MIRGGRDSGLRAQLSDLKAIHVRAVWFAVGLTGGDVTGFVIVLHRQPDTTSVHVADHLSLVALLGGEFQSLTAVSASGVGAGHDGAQSSP